MNLEEKAVRFIQTVAKVAISPLYAGNSGGKDSAVLDWLIQASGIKYCSFYTNPTIDPKGTIGHIRKHYPHTEILQPKESFYQLIERKGLPTRLNRYCCEHLKEYGSVGKIVFEGVRSSESSNRTGRDDDIWRFIDEKNIPVNPAYYNGMTRIGCVGCPLVSRKGVREKEFALYPKYLQAIKKSIKRGMDNNPQWKLSCMTGKNADLAIEWWLSGKTMNEFFL
jgi:phosphoadenosine phosphosulfate reductase